jgi:hypothetical protein
MPDITLCVNKECPLAPTCYRHNCTPDPIHQSYARFEPKEDGECEYYLEMDSGVPPTKKPPTSIGG